MLIYGNLSSKKYVLIANNCLISLMIDRGVQIRIAATHSLNVISFWITNQNY